MLHPLLLRVVLISTLPLAVLAHYYLWARFVRDMAWPQRVRQVATFAIVLAAASVPPAVILRRALPSLNAPWLLWPVACWLGTFFVMLWPLLGVDALKVMARRLAGIFRPHAAVDAERRLLLTRLVHGGALVTGGGLTGVAFNEALQGPVVTPVEVRLSRLRQAQDGFTIAQISDLHIAPLLGRAYVENVVDEVLRVKADLIVVTGDLIDGPFARLRDDAAPLARLHAKHGVHFVTGNHEYYNGVEDWLPELRRLGMRVLRNERVSIGHGDDSFDLAGIDDLGGAEYAPGHGPDLQGALRGRDEARELVLLAHQPLAVHQAAKHGVGLMLSGHTHGGQIWPMGYLVGLVQPYVKGLHQHGDMQIYVNRGTGYVGAPMRLGSPPEITLLTLRTGQPV